MTESVRPPLVVAYVLTNYPYSSQTFLLREIRGVENENIRIERIAVNAARPGDAVTPEQRDESERTYRVKELATLRAILIIAKFAAIHPVVVVRHLLRALGPFKFDPRSCGLRFFHFCEAILIWQRCAATNVSHIHAQFGGMPATVAMLAARIGSAVGNETISWSFTIHGYHDFVNEREIRLGEKAGSAAFVVCVSEDTRAQLMRVSDPMTWSRFRVVRCGVDLDRFTFRDASAVPSAPVVVTVGRLAPEKGQVLLLDAVALLARRGVAARLRFVGDGPDHDRLVRHAEHLGVDAAFLGELEPADVHAQLRCADAFCLASFAEGIPVSLMEAMATGVPVVTSRINGIPELVVDGESGLLVTPGSATAIADALARVLTDHDLAQRLARSARGRVETMHNLTCNTAEMRELLATMSGRSPLLMAR